MYFEDATKFDFSKIMQILSQISIEIHSNKEKEKIKKEICKRCRAFADTYCLDCKLFFCEACLELKHMQNSDLQFWKRNHRTISAGIIQRIQITSLRTGSSKGWKIKRWCWILDWRQRWQGFRMPHHPEKPQQRRQVGGSGLLLWQLQGRRPQKAGEDRTETGRLINLLEES